MSLFVAMVVLGRAELPKIPSLISELRNHSPSDMQSREATVSFTIGGIQVNSGLIATPIPGNELEPMLRTSPYWQKDDALISTHQAHLIVAASGEVEKKLLALTLTSAISAILKATESSVAVYWGAGSVVTEKEAFCNFADSATIDQLPLYLWIDFRCYSKADGCALFTHGMKSLGFMEIEMPISTMSATDTVGLAFNITHYLLDQGPILKDGDTIGMSAEQKLRISHVLSSHDRNEKVYSLEVS